MDLPMDGALVVRRLVICALLSIAALVVFTLKASDANGEITDPPSRGDQFAKRSAQQHEKLPIRTFELLFPSGYGLSKVVVAASDQLLLGPHVQIEAIDGSPGTVTSAGTEKLRVGPDSRTGKIVSRGDIRLDSHVSALSAESSGTVTVGHGSAVGSIHEGAMLTPLVNRPVVVGSLDGKRTDAFVRPTATVTLAPGRYREVKISSHATAIVSAGTYLIDDLDLGHEATLKLDTSGGTVKIYVNRSTVWGGAVAGDASHFIFGLLGRGALVLRSGFRGTALAPWGTLTLAPSSTAYQGTFYGKHVVIGPGVAIHGLATPFLLDGVKVSDTTPCIGESVKVSVDTSYADPAATTWIQGVVGSRQFLQFSGSPGTRLVWAAIYAADGHADFTSVPVTVRDCPPLPGTAPPIALHYWAALRKQNVVEFIVHKYGATGDEVPFTGSANYLWTFGDGQTLATTSSFVSHDYGAAINPMQQFNYFDVSVTATTSSGAAAATKVVPIWSLYAKNRAKGIVQPSNTLSVSSSNLTLTVTNHEHTPVAITQANVELIPCDPALDARALTPIALSLTVAAGATATVNVARPKPIAADICSVGVHLMGSAAAGKVYTDAYASIKENPLLVQAVTDANTIALLNQSSTLAKDPNKFDEFELRQLYGQGSIARLPPSTDLMIAHNFRIADMKGADPKVGDSCTPGDTSPLGLICAPTPGWVFVGPEILNAFKGDFIMDHGCGSIGQLLSAVHQLYSHTSTMVKNRVEVRHSTASSDRLSDIGNINFLTQKTDPDVLKYGFPGTAGPSQTYTIDKMVNEYFVTDPDDSSKTWRMGGELNPDPLNQCANDTTAAMPLVIRPAPDAPASVLQSVAGVPDFANVNSHYRFFNYSRADESLPGSDWANGTVSTVCSSFDRLAAVRAGLPLHPTLNSVPAQCPALPGVPDGMRTYCVEERTIGAFSLFAEMSAEVQQKCVAIGKYFGFIGVTFCSGLTDNIASQVANCFANDECDNTGGAWGNPGTGIAVSPDDMLDWDTWQKGGTYGYNEALVYQPKAFRHAYAWAASPGSGSMTVKVVHTDNMPFANATVLINTNAIGTTASDGTFQIPVLAAGNYEVGAQFDPCATQGPPAAPCTLPPAQRPPAFQLEQASTKSVLPLSGSITVVVTLCAGAVVNGVVTSCPQPGSSPHLTHVGIQGNQIFRPIACFTGDGFTPTAPVDIVYANIPEFSGTVTRTGSADASGHLQFTDNSAPRYSNSCTPDELDGTKQVTINALDNVSGVALQTTVPSLYWCSDSHATQLNGGCP
jgi:hypothetical protein